MNDDREEDGIVMLRSAIIGSLAVAGFIALILFFLGGCCCIKTTQTEPLVHCTQPDSKPNCPNEAFLKGCTPFNNGW